MSYIKIKYQFENTDYYLAIADEKIKSGDKIKIERSFLGRLFFEDKFYSEEITDVSIFPAGQDSERGICKTICCILKCKESLCKDTKYSMENSNGSVRNDFPNVGPGKNKPPITPATPLEKLKKILSQFGTKDKKKDNDEISNIIDSLSTVSELKQALSMLKPYPGVHPRILRDAFCLMLQKWNLSYNYSEAVNIYNEYSRLNNSDVLKALADFLLLYSVDSETEEVINCFQDVSFDEADEKDKDVYAALLSFFYMNGQKGHKEQIKKLSDKWWNYICRIEQKCSNEEIFIELSMLIRHFHNFPILLRKFPSEIADNFEDGNDKQEVFQQLASLYRKYPSNIESITEVLEHISTMLDRNLKENIDNISIILKNPNNRNRYIPIGIQDIERAFCDIKNEKDLFGFEEKELKRLSDSDLDLLLEQVLKNMFNNKNPYKFKAAVELAISAENINKSCAKNAKKIYSQYISKGDKQYDVLFICRWLLEDNKSKQEIAKDFKDEKISDNIIRLNIEWLSYSHEEQQNKKRIEDYMFDSSSAAYNEAEILKNPVEKIYWYFQAAIKGHPQARKKYMDYLNTSEDSPEREAYLEFINNNHQELEKNDGTMKYILWLDKAIALKEQYTIEPLPMSMELFKHLSVQELEKMYNNTNIEDKDTRYYKTIAFLAGEQYLMAYYAQEKCRDANEYRMFINSADSKVLFSKSAIWPDEYSKLSDSDNAAEKAFELLSAVWKGYIKIESEEHCFDTNFSATLKKIIPEEYEYAMFYFSLICSLKNKGKLNQCSINILKALSPQPTEFGPALYLEASSYSKTDEMGKLTKSDTVSEEIKCMAAFWVVDMNRRAGLPPPEQDMYFNSLFKNENYSYDAAKNINVYFDEIKEKIRKDKIRIKKLPLCKESLLPVFYLDEIEQL